MSRRLDPDDDRPARGPRQRRPKPTQAPICGGCGQPAKLVHARAVGRHRPEAGRAKVWRCDDCSTHVGCHPGTTRPLGTLAPASLRRARQELHDTLDQLWRTAPDFYPPEFGSGRGEIKRMAREHTYRFLADALGLTRDQCHIGAFDMATCRRAAEVLSPIDYSHIRDHARARLRRGIG